MRPGYATEIERDEQGRAARLAFRRLPAGEAPGAGDGPEVAAPDPSCPVASGDRRDGHPCAICRLPVPPKRRPGGAPRKHCSPTCRRIAWERAHPGRRGWQAALPGESRVERRFREWIETPAGRYVEAEVIRLAREDLADDYRRGEMNLYLALVRRASRGLTKDRDGYACNNNFRSLLARRVMERVPELAGFFTTRDLRGRP